MDANETKKARKRVNAALALMGRIYHTGLPLDAICKLLTENGFNPSELDGIYCGHDGRIGSVSVSNYTYFAMTWHRMESGRFEVVAYVS